MPQTKLTTKGQITIPKAIRDRLKLKTGDKIAVAIEGQHAILKKADFEDLKDQLLLFAKGVNITQTNEENELSYLTIEGAIDNLVDVIYDNLPAKSKQDNYFDVVNQELMFFYNIRDAFLASE